MSPRSPTSFSAGAVPIVIAAAFSAACTPPPPQGPATVIEWAVGRETLGDAPASSGCSILALSPKASGSAAPAPPPKCPMVTTILPGPDSDPRIFGLIGGKLHAFDTLNADPVLLTGGNPAVPFTRLLAFAKKSPPLTLLVAARPSGAKSEQIWTVTVNGAAVTAAAEVTDKQAFTSKEAFFAQYDAPRCKPGGKECLSLSSDGTNSFLDIEPVRGANPKTDRKLPKVTIDASWASADGNQIYLLVPCSPPKP